MTTTQSAPTIEQIRRAVQPDLKAVDDLIINELVSDIPLIHSVTAHILKSGGKRLRPLVVLLCARCLGYQGHEHHELAAIIEFVHTATLLHDDVVDESKLRRGRDTANAVWGNQASVLVGDFLYSRAFQLLTRRSNVAVMQVLANTTNAIAEGEVLQLMNRNDPEITEAAYLSVIDRKTAQLFSASAHIGAILATEDPALQRNMQHFGEQLGLAFQIIDDLLDYTASSQQIGKEIGDDLAEGKATLPLIYTLEVSDAETQAHIRAAIKDGRRDQLDAILTAMDSVDAFSYTLERAQQYAEHAHNALAKLPDNEYRQALEQLVDFAVHRDY